MSAVDDGLLRRLRALAEMAERGTENEREIAAQRLAELMAKHQIERFDASAPEPEAEEGRLDDEEGAAPSRVECWETLLLASVAEALGGRCWMRGRGRYQQLRMVGPAGSVGAARYMYQWLRRQIGQMARAAARERGETNAWRRAYATGVVSRVYRRMVDARRVVVSQSNALVLVDRQKAVVDAKFETLGELRKQRGGGLQRPDARVEGWRDGESVDIGSASAGRIGEGPRRLR